MTKENVGLREIHHELSKEIGKLRKISDEKIGILEMVNSILIKYTIYRK